jgi:4-carboxymuconolactone decarboxylase
MPKAEQTPSPSLKKAAKVARNHRSAAFQDGLAIRSQVLGPDYVQAAFENADELSMPFQELATEFAWGSVWTREGLSLRERSLMTMAMCIALNRPRELQIHLRGALRNGIEPELLPEIVLHAFIYCGGPATIDAMHAIRQALPALKKEMKAKAKAQPKQGSRSKAPPSPAQPRRRAKA